jgi:energy-coupling factor transport system substrate-specific component
MNNKSLALTMAALGIVVNLVLGTTVAMLKIPLLFLDTLGTIFVAAVLGPVYGAMAGGLTNLIQGMITNPGDIPFALVNIVIGIVVGLIARRYGFNYWVAFLTGLILAVVAPLIGTPIVVWLFGGVTGGGIDFVFAWLLHSTQDIFKAAFLSRITGNLVDKVASCLLVAFLIKNLSAEIISRFGDLKQKSVGEN